MLASNQTSVSYFNLNQKYVSSFSSEIMLLIPLFTFTIKQVTSDVVYKSANFVPKIFLLQRFYLCNFYGYSIHICSLMAGPSHIFFKKCVEYFHTSPLNSLFFCLMYLTVTVNSILRMEDNGEKSKQGVSNLRLNMRKSLSNRRLMGERKKQTKHLRQEIQQRPCNQRVIFICF